MRSMYLVRGLTFVALTTVLVASPNYSLIAQVDANGAHTVSEEALIYRAAKSSVVTVETDFGHGSGFVIDNAGMILTNQHVTNGTQWLAVHFGRGVRLNAVVVFEDKESDVAVVAFNPAAVKSVTPLPLADADKGLIAVEGERVVAIGNPLHQDTVLTTGIVSKVESGVIISNVNINHGSSGGPLLNLSGKVIGITTFADLTTQGGPGISGIVSIEKAKRAITEARSKMSTITTPSAVLLPDISPVPIPGEALAEAAKQKINIETIKVPNFKCSIMTPFYNASKRAELDREVAKNTRRRGNNPSQSSEPVRFWEQFVGGDALATVSFVLQPEIKETSGSHGRKTAALLGTILTGIPFITKQSFEFRADFSEMQLYRGDVLIEPVRRNKVPVSAMYDTGLAKIKDKSYGGFVQYDPSAFEPSEKIRIMVRQTADPKKWDTIELDPQVQNRIWTQFAPYRDALQSGHDK